jgi:Domain of unknown function (DUF4133)
MATVYQVNRGINKSMEFKGLKAQYIWYLAAGLVGSLLIFAVLFVVKVNNYLCMTVAFAAGGSSIGIAYRLSNKYGEHGLMKKRASRGVPKVLKSNSRKVFVKTE